MTVLLGAAPPVMILTGCVRRRRSLPGAKASMPSTVGAPQRWVTPNRSILAKISVATTAALDHMGSAHRRDRPGKTPAVAVKHRQGPEMGAGRPQSSAQRLAESHQIGAAMMANDALGIAGRSRGVVEGDRLPLVVGHPDRRIRIAAGNEVLVLDPVAFRRVARLRRADFDQGRGMPDLCQGRLGDRHQFGIDQEGLALGMLQDECHRLRIEPVVDRVEDAARHGRRIVHLQRRDAVGREHRNRVVLADAGLAERVGRLPAAPPHLGIGDDAFAVDDRGLARKDQGRAFEKRDGRQRLIVGSLLAEGSLVFARRHVGFLPVPAHCGSGNCRHRPRRYFLLGFPPMSEGFRERYHCTHPAGTPQVASRQTEAGRKAETRASTKSCDRQNLDGRLEQGHDGKWKWLQTVEVRPTARPAGIATPLP